MCRLNHAVMGLPCPSVSRLSGRGITDSRPVTATVLSKGVSRALTLYNDFQRPLPFAPFEFRIVTTERLASISYHTLLKSTYFKQRLNCCREIYCVFLNGISAWLPRNSREYKRHHHYRQITPWWDLPKRPLDPATSRPILRASRKNAHQTLCLCSQRRKVPYGST